MAQAKEVAATIDAKDQAAKEVRSQILSRITAVFRPTTQNLGAPPGRQRTATFCQARTCNTESKYSRL